MYCMVLYVVCGLYGCDVHYMSVQTIEEKALSVVECRNQSDVCP